jgi:hypothetical protein
VSVDVVATQPPKKTPETRLDNRPAVQLSALQRNLQLEITSQIIPPIPTLFFKHLDLFTVHVSRPDVDDYVLGVFYMFWQCL